MKKVALGILFFAPTAFVFAAELGNIRGLIDAIAKIVASIIPIVFALILVYFFWGLAKFVLNSDDEEARKGGRQMMIWGIVALFVASSVWGLTAFLGDAIGVTDPDKTIVVPGIR